MIKECLKDTWNAYRKNILAVLGANILVNFIIILLASIGLVPVFFNFYNSPNFGAFAAELEKEAIDTKLILPIFENFLTNLIKTETWIVYFAAGFLVISLLAGFLLKAGLVKFYAELFKKKADIKIITRTAAKKWKDILGANILASLVILIPAFIISIIQEKLVLYASLIFMLLVLLFLRFVNQAVVLENKTPVEAVKKSIVFVKENIVQVLILALVFNALVYIFSYSEYISPLLPVLIEGLIIAPLTVMAFTCLYLKTKKQA